MAPAELFGSRRERPQVDVPPRKFSTHPGWCFMTNAKAGAGAVKALFFDVFGTLMDWRNSVAPDARSVLEPLGFRADWVAFAEAWRGEYHPSMEEVRSGRVAFAKLDVLHRQNLERVL